jgi:hypothetical protein
VTAISLSHNPGMVVVQSNLPIRMSFDCNLIRIIEILKELFRCYTETAFFIE